MQDIDPRIDALIDAYIDSSIDDKQFAALCDWLREDAGHRQAFARKLALHSEMAEWCIERSGGKLAGHLDTDDTQLRGTNAGTVLAELTELEEHGEVLDPMALAAEQFPKTGGVSVGKKQYIAALSYVMEHAATSKRLAVLGAAAAVLLGVVLAISFIASEDGLPERAELPGLTPAPRTHDLHRVVATVTGQVNAQWVSANGQGALPDRMLLGVNQRLTLTEGFAEITTTRGAKVLIQAPATIETTDSDNAVRLHRGKLVGICETPSSKGFVVHAPGMDVIDLGTEFGVAADETNGSTVLVLSGSVRAKPAQTSPLAFEPVVLQQGDARRVEPETGGLETITAQEAMLFHRGSNHPYVRAVLEAGPIAYWRFEDAYREQDGQPFFAIRNERNHEKYSLSSVGSAALDAEGLLGSCGRLSNNQPPRGYFELAGLMAGLDGMGSLTVQLWFKADDHQLGTLIDYYDRSEDRKDPKHIAVMELQSGAGLTNADQLENWKPDSVRAFYNNPPQRYGLTRFSHNLFSEQAYRAEQWHQLVLVKKPDSIQLYIDGRQSSAHDTALARSPVGQLMIGVSSKVLVRPLDGDEDIRSFTGLIDEVAVYDRALSKTEIARHWSLAEDLLAGPRN
ncbi:MAG: LamG-like jellyroll fold domain-containing protein [Planctomycetota bacterium]